MAVSGPNASTNFMNSSHRRIFKSAGGRYFVRNADGSKQYKPKAAFHSMPGKKSATVVHGRHVIPRAIRPKGLSRAKAVTPKMRGRPIKYASNNNRKAAKRAAAKRYYMRKRTGLVNMSRL